MNVFDRLTRYLKENNTAYELLFHNEVYTSQELAEVLHTPGKSVAKVVIIRADNRSLMIVLAASTVIDLPKLRSFLNANELSIVPEADFPALFPGAEIGAMPPFGNLYSMPVFVDEELALDREITFNAGTHYEAIRMRYSDFARLVHPTVLSIGVPI